MPILFVHIKFELWMTILNNTISIIIHQYTMAQIFENIAVEYINNKFYFAGNIANMLVPIMINKDKLFVAFTPKKNLRVCDPTGQLIKLQYHANLNKTIFAHNNIMYKVKLINIEKDSITFVLKSRPNVTSKWSSISQHTCIDDVFMNGKHHYFVRKFPTSNIRVVNMNELFSSLFSSLHAQE